MRLHAGWQGSRNANCGMTNDCLAKAINDTAKKSPDTCYVILTLLFMKSIYKLRPAGAGYSC